MSPEQLEGMPLDGRSDLFSLGVTMYWLLTGTRPFDGKSEPMTIDAIMRKNPQRPRERNPMVPPAVDNIVMRLLEKDRARRTPTGAVLADEILALLGPTSGYSTAATFAGRAMAWPTSSRARPSTG
jgi:serine/threonine protein kinase